MEWSQVKMLWQASKNQERLYKLELYSKDLEIRLDLAIYPVTLEKLGRSVQQLVETHPDHALVVTPVGNGVK